LLGSAIAVRELCGTCVYHLCGRDEAVLTTLVFVVLLEQFRSLWHRAKYWALLLAALVAHCAALWLVCDLLLGGRYRINSFTLLVVASAEACFAAYYFGLFQYYDRRGVR
jgi:hypothetical protein